MQRTCSYAVETGEIFIKADGMWCIIFNGESVVKLVGEGEKLNMELFDLVAADKKVDDVGYAEFFHLLSCK
jgi:hypothetical protein